MLITNEDNMELMARYEDNYFDLAIVDPPYGINITKNKRLNNNSNNDWDNEIPSDKYFKELKRVSKNQIIWGGNYFVEYLENTRCYLNWDKLNHSNTYADCEMAWTSFDKNAKIFKYMWDGNRYGFPNAIKGVGKKSIRTHPTQKPIALYEWLLMNYAKQGDKILDTHLGSGSIALACHNLGYDLTACELDKEYYDAAIKRIDQHKAQIRMF
jgi:site-specific DNA-methyltransferase (adenine-specific)